MSALTMRRLIQEQDLGMCLLAGVSKSHVQVSVASTTELPRPGRYVVKGELVMTNGLWMPARPVKQWVAEIAEAEAAALCWGLDDDSTTVPPEVVLACSERGLSLASVASSISFAYIAERVRALTWATAEHALRDHLSRGRQFAGITLNCEAILDELMRQGDLRGCIIDPEGTVLASTMRRNFDEQIPSFLKARFPNSLPAPVDGTVVFPIVPTLRSRCSVLVIDSDMNSLNEEVLLIVNLATLTAAACDAREVAMDEHRTDEVDLILTLLERDALGPEECRARLAALGLSLSGGVRVLIIGNSPSSGYPNLQTLRGMSAAWRDVKNAREVLIDSNASIGLGAALSKGHSEREPDLGWGSVAYDGSGLRRSLVEARLHFDARLGARAGDRTARAGDRTAHARLLSLIEPSARISFASGVLGVVRDWDRTNSGQLLDTLAAYFRRDGRPALVSRELFIHPNTLRNRLARIEELTGRSLNVTADRIDLALAVELLVQED